jgi:propanol-preferring alcohol dehydrogenase
MRAFVLREYHRDMVLEDVKEPIPDPHEIILKVRSCGVCHTDTKIISGQIPSPYIKLPHIIGHEISGDIVAIGSEVKNVAVGQRGLVYHYVTCGHCEMCRRGRENLCFFTKRLGFELPGGMAEYVKLPADNICLFNESVDFGKMAIVPDAIATPYHALKTLAEIKAGQDVLIVGAGGLGIHAIQIANLMGGQVIAGDRRKDALELARQLGAEFVIDTSSENPLERVMEITQGKGVHAVIEIVGSPQTLQWSLPSLRRGGRLVLVGYAPSNPFPLNSMDMHYNEWVILGSKASTRQELLEVIDLMERGKIKAIVSKEVTWTEANEVLREILEGRVSGRTVLKFEGF